MMATHPQYVFVYGTLREAAAHDMHRVLARLSTLVGDGRVNARLYDLGDYPGIVLSSAPHEWVRGEVYELKPDATQEALRILDGYEGLDADDPHPPEYTRGIVRVQFDGDRVIDAWAYVLARVLPAYRLVSSSDYLEWKKAKARVSEPGA